MPKFKITLPIIVISQFCCTSLWFAGNSVMNNLIQDFQLEENALSHLTSSVQFGFILGTFLFALFTIADRFSPSKIFFSCALLAAFFNLGMIWKENNLFNLLLLRFCTGFFLAGIYPIGMKIASDYYKNGLGKSLGYLVGALTIGTAFPHLLKELVTNSDWKLIIIGISCLAIFGGILMYAFIPNGPYQNVSQKIDFSALFKIFKNNNFRAAAFGYFGHMWELYTFWAFVPIILSTYKNTHQEVSLNISFLSFLVIGLGGIACVISGYLSTKMNVKKLAFTILLLSCFCCIISPLVFMNKSLFVLVGFLIFWGMVVIADSPLFSTLVANSATPKTKGTALTIVNCIGFSITIISIQLINILNELINPIYIFVLLAIGPIFGLITLFNSHKTNPIN